MPWRGWKLSMLISFSKTKLIPAALQEGNSALNDLFNK